MANLTVSPAYGRDYKSGKAAKADWVAGKDFIVQGLGRNGYVSINDAPAGQHTIRYNGMRNLVHVTVDPMEVEARAKTS